MKTVFASALIAVAALAVPATAEVASGSAAAVAHFNQDYDSQDNRRTLRNVDNSTFVSTRSGNLDVVYGKFNADYDGQDNVRGQNGVTVISNQPSYGAGIFADIRRANAEDE